MGKSMLQLATLLLVQSMALSSAQESDTTHDRVLRQRNVVRQGKDLVRNHEQMVASTLHTTDSTNDSKTSPEKAMENNKLRGGATSVQRDMQAGDVCGVAQIISVPLFPVDVLQFTGVDMSNLLSPDHAHLTFCTTRICLNLSYLLNGGMTITGIDIDKAGVGVSAIEESFLPQEGDEIPILGDGLQKGAFTGCIEAHPISILRIMARPESYWIKIRTTDFPDGAVMGHLIDDGA